jgi:hypothetical protein
LEKDIDILDGSGSTTYSKHIDIGIKPDTHILHIIDHNIYIGQIFLGRLKNRKMEK